MRGCFITPARPNEPFIEATPKRLAVLANFCALQAPRHMRYSLNSLKEVYLGEHIGEYYKGYQGGYWEFRL